MCVPHLYGGPPTKQAGNLPGDSLDVTWTDPLSDRSAYSHFVQFEAVVTRGLERGEEVERPS